MENKKPNTEKTVYSVAEIAAMLDVSLPNAYAISRSENFPSFTVGRRVLIPKAAFEQWLRDQSAGQTFESYKDKKTPRQR